MKKPDLFITVDDTTLVVEAKRVRSYAKLGRHVGKAVKQIAAACDRGDAVAGFVALDLSFAVDLHAQTGLWSLPSRSALPGLRAQLDAQVTSLIGSVGEKLREQPASHNIVGATILTLPVVHYADTRQLGLVRYFKTGQLDGDRSVAGRAAYRALHDRCFADR